MPLRADLSVGLAAEDATRNAAAVWGMPDFVYRPTVRPAGTGQRELGDALILVGRLGVVIQVKSRSAVTGGTEREQSWLVKSVAKAISQADGTIRSLKQHGTAVVNGRGRSITLEGGARLWISAVVIDHASAPEVEPDISSAKNPVVVLARADWEFLFQQLKSSYAVAAYLARVAGDPIPVGTESIRYYQLANADHEAESDPLDPRLAEWNLGRVVGSPNLPLYPTDPDDERAHRLLRLLFEDVATSEGPATIDEHHRLQALAELDRLPVVDRAQIGRFLLASMESAGSATPDVTEWRFRSIVGTPREGAPVHLGFCVCSQGTESHRQAFASWVQLRHHELRELLQDDFTTVAILLTPRTDGRRPWDTTMVATSGDLQLDPETVADLSAVWNNKELATRW